VVGFVHVSVWRLMPRVVPLNDNFLIQGQILAGGGERQDMRTCQVAFSRKCLNMKMIRGPGRKPESVLPGGASLEYR